MRLKNITAHSVVRNEPFIYYSIMSVYHYVDKILLYDTGSYDEHTLQDIERLLKEDKKKKITFKEVEIDLDETKWSLTNIGDMIKQNRGKTTVGSIRKMQIEDTTTEYFMILDGDEVHYKKTMQRIMDDIIPKWDPAKICYYLPLEWYYDLKTIHDEYKHTGRLFKTDSTWLTDDSPNEIHINKRTKNVLHPNSKDIKILTSGMLKPFAHFEMMIKPWRRPITKLKMRPAVKSLPEVMVDEPYFIERFRNGLGKELERIKSEQIAAENKLSNSKYGKKSNVVPSFVYTTDKITFRDKK